ncbi:DUF2231 domain-containing protein [Nocardioides sp. AX2bis]|uniref:DUF2231 domain-containing protein n=1 Tax=Nocardioides sp. AX2bis TaxID=2653157 RepID=UPI0012EF450D|nr:DUF2231 domain-containing protein [Nocardioides sp. AX2bis]VXC46528.1 Xylose isomerase [Nocardioides sp. AX2bis]
MFDTINGLPWHPLVVHGVVVLLPLAILGTVLIAVVPRWRTRYGVLVVATALVATVLVPISTSSGESLEERVGDPGEHAELGEQLLWFALALLLTSALLVGLHWRAERAARRSSGDAGAGTATSKQLTAVAAVAVLAAVACGVQVYRVGDSGARAAWGDVPSASGG